VKPHSKGSVAPTFLASGDRVELSSSPRTRAERRTESALYGAGFRPRVVVRLLYDNHRRSAVRGRTSADRSCGSDRWSRCEPGAPRGTAATPETQDAWAREPPYARRLSSATGFGRSARTERTGRPQSGCSPLIPSAVRARGHPVSDHRLESIGPAAPGTTLGASATQEPAARTGDPSVALAAAGHGARPSKRTTGPVWSRWSS